MTDWQPGDLALCVIDDAEGEEYISTTWRVRKGNIYTVADVVPTTFGEDGLDLVEDTDPHWDACWNASWFVKVTPGADIEGIEAEKRLTGKVGQDA